VRTPTLKVPVPAPTEERDDPTLDITMPKRLK
jgi:hypothetical protein